ncbi:hypothetical protein GF374_02490, partial [Candidatus Woesearchaeota archaeon]|nr:hypothetical protein [Candidatus Woesearchaeota archaeon]
MAEEKDFKKKEREHLKEMQNLQEKEAREKDEEESWLGRRKIGLKHKGARFKERAKRAPKSAYHGIRRKASGLPGGAAAALKKQTKSKAKHFLRTLLIIIFIIAIIAIVVYYFSSTATGTLVTSEKGGVTSQVTNAARESGAVKTLNQFKMIMLGEYDPSQLWSSETYEDKYAMEDAGVKLSEVKPFRQIFLPDQEIAITGRLKVSSLPEEDITTHISAEWGNIEKLSGTLGDWTCDPETIEKKNLFIGRFICNHDSISVEPGLTKSFVTDVKVKYDFDTKTGKQVYIADYEQMSQLQFEEKDPMNYYDISSDQLKSWQTKSPLDLGIGILGEEDILIANKKGEYELGHYLGITIENDGGGDLTSLNELTITLPKTIEIADPETSRQMDFEYEKQGEVGNTSVTTYELKPKYYESITKDGSLAPGEYK